MTKFTKEEQIQAIYDLKAGYTLGHADIAMLKAMARQLLAGLEQEPVAWIVHTHGGNQLSNDVSYVSNAERFAGIRSTPLYAAPQLPQPAVTEKMTAEKMPSDIKQLPAATALVWMEGWNACRAAMLQGAENVQEQHESAGSACKCRSSEKVQVLQAGWMAVPVEPTMSQEFAGYKTLNDTGKMSRLMKTRLANIYRAMVTAAPQQEVKP